MQILTADTQTSDKCDKEQNNKEAKYDADQTQIQINFFQFLDPRSEALKIFRKQQIGL